MAVTRMLLKVGKWVAGPGLVLPPDPNGQTRWPIGVIFSQGKYSRYGWHKVLNVECVIDPMLLLFSHSLPVCRCVLH